MSLNEAQRRHARSHHGVFTHQQLIDLGSTRRQIQVFVKNGTLRSPVRGVFVVNASTNTFEQQCGIVCAANPLASISHRSAGRLLGMRDLGYTRDLEVTIPYGKCMAFGAMTVHRSTYLPPDHIVERADGIRHTGLLRTGFDVCAVLGDQAVESIIEQMLDKFGTSVSELFAIGSEMRAPGRNGSARFVRVLGSRPTFRKPAGSAYEVVLLGELRRIGLPDPLRQAEIAVPDEQPLHPDFFWPAAQLAVEVDHAFWHAHRLAVQYDKRRDRKLGAVGVHVLRVTEEDVDQHLATTAREIEAVWKLRTRGLVA